MPSAYSAVVAVAAASMVLAVAVMAAAMVAKEAVAAVAVMVAVCIHNKICRALLGSGGNHWAGAVKSHLWGGQGREDAEKR